MRNRIAEWLLSQAAPPEQSTTVLGDLLEADLSPVAFWFAVVGATLSIAIHHPRHTLTRFFWFAYQLAYFESMVWFPSHTSLSSVIVRWILLTAAWVTAGIPLEKWTRRQSVGMGYYSVLALGIMFVSMTMREGHSFRYAVLTTLPGVAFCRWLLSRITPPLVPPRTGPPAAG